MPPRPNPDERKAPAAAPSSITGTRTGAHRALARVGTEEFHSMRLPAAQEAAVLYSANRNEAATALLKAEIKDTAGKGNKQAWLMLFDLYQAAQNRAEFDSLSMLFSVKFEQSPPAWAEGGGDSGDPRRAEPSRERKDLFVLKPGLTGELAGEIEKFRAFAESMGTVRLDVGKITHITPEEATLLGNALLLMRKKNLPIWFNNVASFEGVLRSAFNEKATEIQRYYWLLLFDLLIIQGKMQEFEDLGLEYAVAFEMSPPNWEVYVNTVAAAAAKTPGIVKPAAAQQTDIGFPLKGVISSASANQIAELNGYAASLSEVAIDTGKVLRIDFAFASAFFDVIKAIQLAGKRVILSNLNELNAGLLEAFGFNRYAILVRKKSI
jgi:anti-anti-sigma regulatory factor